MELWEGDDRYGLQLQMQRTEEAWALWKLDEERNTGETKADLLEGRGPPTWSRSRAD